MCENMICAPNSLEDDLNSPGKMVSTARLSRKGHQRWLAGKSLIYRLFSHENIIFIGDVHGFSVATFEYRKDNCTPLT